MHPATPLLRQELSRARKSLKSAKLLDDKENYYFGEEFLRARKSTKLLNEKRKLTISHLKLISLSS